jgi:hypothetical protein
MSRHAEKHEPSSVHETFFIAPLRRCLRIITPRRHARDEENLPPKSGV